MSKGPTPRHSKKAEPVTIDLDATDVTPHDETLKPAAARSGAADEQADTVVGTADETPDQPPQENERDENVDSEEPPRSGDEAGMGPSPAPSRDLSPARAITGGIAGGAVAFAVLYALQTAGIIPVPGAGSEPMLTDQVAAINARVGDLTQRVAQFPDGDEAGLAEVTGRLDALEQVVGSASAGAPGAAVANLDKRVTAMAEKLSAIEARPAGNADGTDSASPAAIEALQAENSRFAAELETLQAQSAALEQSQSELQASLTARIEKAEAQLDEPDREMEMARAIASSGLKAAIDRGGPFAAELEAFASVAPDDPAIADLRGLAATGVPTPAQLADTFADIAERIIAAARPAPPDQGLVDRLVSSAQSMVTVRPVGEVEGDSVEAIVARIESRLKSGELENALAEWQKLPEEAKGAAGGFGSDLAARVQVEKLMDGALRPVSGAAPAKTTAE